MSNPDVSPEDAVRQLVRDELASLGGHLLTTYGTQAAWPGDAPIVSTGNATSNAEAAALARLGGYLLQHYGPEDAPTGE